MNWFWVVVAILNFPVKSWRVTIYLWMASGFLILRAFNGCLA